VARRIVRGLKMCAQLFRITEVLMMATTPAAARMCKRFGTATHLACDHFSVRIKE
jgi:hypothetical protein